MLLVTTYSPSAPPKTSSTSRMTSLDQPMCLGNMPLVMTLWLITVSAAMCPSSAFSKFTPPAISAATFSMSNRST
jgi:hypothetical protein